MTAYWTDKVQPAEMVEKRAASMRGKKRKPYGPKSPQAAANHAAAMVNKKLEPSVECDLCGTTMRPSGLIRHRQKCETFQCAIAGCDGGIRFSGRGYCQSHYVMHKQLGRHGLSVEQYLAMYDACGGLCAICRRSCLPKGLGAANNNKNSVICVDHDHVTGAVRGLLCHPCNLVLGLASDSSSVLRAAADYLERHDR